MLLLGGVRLAVLGLEEGEMVVGVQELVDGLRTFGDDLADQRIVGDGVHEGIRGGECGGEEGESEDERESQRRHYRSGEEERGVRRYFTVGGRGFIYSKGKSVRLVHIRYSDNDTCRCGVG